MKKEIIIVGARGLGKEIVGYVEEHGDYKIKCILDELEIDELFGYEVIHPSIYNYSCRDAVFAVGYPNDKKIVLEKYQHLDLNWINFIHPLANVSKHSHLGNGVVIAPFSVIAGDAKLGSFIFCDSFSSAGHDSLIRDFSTLMPYASVTGFAEIGEESLLSIGAKVLPSVRVGNKCRISANTVVNHDIPDKSFAFGNPAKLIPDLMQHKK